MVLTKSPAGRSLKVFAGAAGSYAGALIFLGLLEFVAFVWNKNPIKTIFSVWFVAVMFIICIGTLLFLTISSIITYIHVCKEKQKKFLIFALPAQIISTALLFVSIVLLTKDQATEAACWMNIVGGIVCIYLAIVSGVFKHITWNKVMKSERK